MEPISNPPSLAGLIQKWPDLAPVDRALGIHSLHLAGKTFSSLAKALNCSESGIRHLDWAARASTPDLLLARAGKISTRQLVCRSKAEAKQRASQDQEALKQKRRKAAEKGAVLICEWLIEHQRDWASGERVVDDARRKLAAAEFVGTLPLSPPPAPEIPVTEVIRRMRPPACVNVDVDSDSWYADWLARWAFYAFPDSAVRDTALNIALDCQIRDIEVPQKRPRKRSL